MPTKPSLDGRRPDRATIGPENADVLVEAKEMFDISARTEAMNRGEWRDDIRFARLGDQWDSETLRQRNDENRPALTINKMPHFIRRVTNDARKNRQEILVKPVDSEADPETAEVMNGIFRNIERISDADTAYDTGIDFAATMGVGYWRVDIDYADDDVFEQDLLIKRIANAFSVYGDPFDQGADSQDWNSCFIVENMPRKKFERLYKGAAPMDWEAGGYSYLEQPWFSEESVLVCEWFRRTEEAVTIWRMSDGSVVREDVLEAQRETFYLAGVIPMQSRPSKSYKITHYLLTGAEVLETNDWPGKYIPVVPCYGDDVNVEGVRHLRSLIRDIKDPQRYFNYWRTATTEMVALAPKAPWIGEERTFAGKDARKWEEANRANHSYISYPKDAQPPQRMALGKDMPVGAWAEASAADEDMYSILGIDKFSDDRSRPRSFMNAPQSGEAIFRQRQDSETQTFHFPDNQRRAQRHTARICLDLIPFVYSGPRVQRVIGKDGNERTCQLGEQGCPKQPGQQDRDGVYALDGIYDLTAGKYDLVPDSGPSYSTQREEAREGMLALVQSDPRLGPYIGDLIAKSMDWPGAQEIAARLKAINPLFQQQGEDPRLGMMQQYIGQLEQEIQKLTQDQQEAVWKAMNDAANTQINAYKAESDRIKALTDAGEAITSALNPPGPYNGGG